MLYQTFVLIKIAYYWENEKNMQMFAEKKYKILQYYLRKETCCDL